MATDHHDHDELEGLRTRVAELEELVQQLGQQLDGLSEHLEYRFQRHHERIEAVDDDARRRDQDLAYEVDRPAATPRPGRGTPRPDGAGSRGAAARLAELAGLSASGLVVDHGMRGARTGLACGAACGNPAPARGPAGCLLDGCHLAASAVKGRCALLSARSALRAVP